MSVTTVAGSFITVNTIDSDHYVDGSIDTVHLGANQIDGTKLAIASQAAGDVMYYNGTDWIRLAKGTADQVLTMNDGATAPNWEAAAAGGIASLAADTTPQVGGSAGLDLQAQLLVGNGGTTGIAITANGEVTMAAQPCVTAKNNSNDTDVTGDGTYFTVDFDSELFDQGSDFASDTFTAPVTGRYAVNVKIGLGHITSSATSCYVFFTTSNRSWTAVETNPGNIQTSSQLGISVSAIIDMDAADTFYVRCVVSGISQVVDCLGGGADPTTWISVTLAA